jgi:hypothetical protein
VRVSTQVSPHSVCPVGQAHVPVSHTWPPVQTLPQLPQCCALVCVLTQVWTPADVVTMASTTLNVDWPHNCSPPGQAQAPASQVCVDTHAVPQLPQCCSSLCVSTHSLPHTLSLPGQAQADPLQLAVLGHALPQPPQCCSSLATSTQSLPQSEVGTEQPAAAE